MRNNFSLRLLGDIKTATFRLSIDPVLVQQMGGATLYTLHVSRVGCSGGRYLIVMTEMSRLLSSRRHRSLVNSSGTSWTSWRDYVSRTLLQNYFVLMFTYLAMASASALLMLRTIALWHRDRRIVVPLLVAHTGQIG